MLSIQSKAQDLMEMLKAAERVHENSRKKRGRREHVNGEGKAIPLLLIPFFLSI
jgi:hypothetical protein